MLCLFLCRLTIFLRLRILNKFLGNKCQASQTRNKEDKSLRSAIGKAQTEFWSWLRHSNNHKERRNRQTTEERNSEFLRNCSSGYSRLSCNFRSLHRKFRFPTIDAMIFILRCMWKIISSLYVFSSGISFDLGKKEKEKSEQEPILCYFGIDCYNDPQLVSFFTISLLQRFVDSVSLISSAIIINFSLKLNGIEGELFIASEAGLSWESAGGWLKVVGFRGVTSVGVMAAFGSFEPWVETAFRASFDCSIKMFPATRSLIN